MGRFGFAPPTKVVVFVCKFRYIVEFIAAVSVNCSTTITWNRCPNQFNVAPARGLNQANVASISANCRPNISLKILIYTKILWPFVFIFVANFLIYTNLFTTILVVLCPFLSTEFLIYWKYWQPFSSILAQIYRPNSLCTANCSRPNSRFLFTFWPKFRYIHKNISRSNSGKK